VADDRLKDWWHPEVHADRRPLLLARIRLRAAIRSYFEQEGFIEVECGALQRSPGNEAHLHALSTEVIDPAGRAESRYLHTSPEFACKKLLAAGERRLFSFAPAFRNRERGPLHAPEFTMLEWYRAEAPYEAVMQDCLAILRLAAPRLSYRGGSLDTGQEPERLTVTEAFRRHAGVDLMANPGNADTLAAQLPGLRRAADDSWSDLFSRALATLIEPKLGRERPTLLSEYPASEAALARACPHDPRIAERFELYALGVELANGFGELTDAAIQRARFQAEMDEKARVHGERYPIDEGFLSALALMPEASGVALGFDRLVMLATGAPHIDQVIWTPYEGDT
jgi:lysyl-tRNA synthetase class 2